MYESTINGTWVAAHSLEEAAAKLSTSTENVKQDPDVLDTWFSSALFPFTSFGWPNQVHNISYSNYLLWAHYFPAII